MRIIGLTGSIGMGKSAAARYLRFLGIPVYDSDATVHSVYARGGAAVGPVGALWPIAVRDGAVDREALDTLINADNSVLPQLEKTVHPIVHMAQQRFLLSNALRRQPVIALDIPLLFETGGENRCDAVFVVSAPAFIQRARVLARSRMTPEKFDFILARQTPDDVKRERADVVVPSHQGWLTMLNILRDAVGTVLTRPARHWPPDPATFTRRASCREMPSRFS
ncbi:MAG: dephospho-CoA kinase [Rhodospirillaceae bacterium]|nr:dephospho-CoA kinase [Rhodospirillaceae bacterium]MCY4238703.1 dephospho-CoA kinase [Rhodospirillaceae bacterium]MCY4310424.1 dephospho-CoA kinase [Rhodospirillaceae bacterium]